MLKFITLFLSIASTVYFLNDKFSKAVRVIAFHEDEDEKGAKISFYIMIFVIICWTIYFGLF